MQILNLINKEKSDIDYSISRFPDGEVQITLGEFSRKDVVTVKCRITNAEELFILMQACDILKRHGVWFTIDIYYLMGMRMDRVMDFNRPFTLSIMYNALDHLGAESLRLYSPHSWEYARLLKNTRPYLIPLEGFDIEWDKYQRVIPDRGAEIRYNISPEERCVYGSKSRDLKTGKILSIGIENPEDIDGRPLLIRDDLCDGGGTFSGLAKAIREIRPEIELSIMVDHMVNPKGIENLSKNFNHVWFTNSYKTWENLPDNVIQIEIV